MRGAAGLLADGAGALLLAPRAVLQPLLQAADMMEGQSVKRGPELAGHCWIQARVKRNGTESEGERGETNQRAWKTWPQAGRQWRCWSESGRRSS